MFWSEQQQRNARAVADREAEAIVRSNFAVTVEEAKKEVHPIAWLSDYERRADERKAAWEASPFAAAVAKLVH